MTYSAMTERDEGYLIGPDEWDNVVGNFDELGGALTGYTPTLGGSWTEGDGTLGGAYRHVGKRLAGRAFFTFGATSAAHANGATLSLPAGITSAAEPQAVTVVVYDASSGDVIVSSGIVLASSTTVITAVTSSTLTFATGDHIAVDFTGLETT